MTKQDFTIRVRCDANDFREEMDRARDKLNAIMKDFAVHDTVSLVVGVIFEE